MILHRALTQPVAVKRHQLTLYVWKNRYQTHTADSIISIDDIESRLANRRRKTSAIPLILKTSLACINPLREEKRPGEDIHSQLVASEYSRNSFDLGIAE